MKTISDLYTSAPETADLTKNQTLIFNAAIELFAKNGYSNTSTSEIASLAGVSEGSIFGKFGSKKGLLMCIITPLINSIIPNVLHEMTSEGMLSDCPHLEDFLRTIVISRIPFLVENVSVLKIFVSELIYNDDMKLDLISSLPHYFIDDITNEINELKDQGEMVNWSNTEIFRFMASTIAGYFIQHYIIFPTETWNEDAEVEHLIQYMLTGLSATNH
ncbi:TetR/AcrR family transcriptional regulator [Paucilactobacillus suebicus]|uniref:TetR family transcriptional regulator n=1 Tax=Paucilactobacillus suebicus DSM 5007 = KCTC 3549 TaxID=1423807 RepID=A0A0R1W6Z3_9LACO|nr:TetR/AcrR family transcriptional regulator [Paucilactobacillus suebicus]KRM11684.1 TetR family transcriptional regulator [Paucilactobacillus suebicus DSM 5007 = KCTC 3549]